MSTQDNLHDADGKLENQNQSPDHNNEAEQDPADIKLNEENRVLQNDDTPTNPSDEDHSETHNSEDEEELDRFEDKDLETLVQDFEVLLKNNDLYAIRPQVKRLRKVFNTKFSQQLNEAKAKFLEAGGKSIDFSFNNPHKKKFNELSKLYREKNETFEKNKSLLLKQNLEARLEIIEQIKNLIDVNTNSTTNYNQFKTLQERWHNLGHVPAKEANSIWNNYRHHVEKFYDFLHLDRDLRDRDYQHNLEKKQKLIQSAKALANETNLNRAFRELQALHKIWKNELGPVAKEYRESLWEEFSAATKVINDKRQLFNDQIEAQLLANHQQKEDIIKAIHKIASSEYQNHSEWQKQTKEIETLRETFIKIGGVPKKMRAKSWSDFKQAVRTFNKNKNNFYKSLKREQSQNLEKKKELIEVAEQNKDSEDFETTVALMINIQNQWKKIGHVPRKESGKLWKQFRQACNHFFDRYHEFKNAGTEEENIALKNKKDLLDSLKTINLGNDEAENLELIKGFVSKWGGLGRVPKNKTQIDNEFYSAIEKLSENAGISKEDIETFKYSNKISKLAQDSKGLNKEISFVRNKIEEISSEINQLENNRQFFSNVNDDNPMVVEVLKKIETQKVALEQWTKKLNIIKKVIN